MKPLLYPLTIFLALFVLISGTPTKEEFQGKAYYFSKSTLKLGASGARMTDAQKKQVQVRLKNIYIDF